ncbi:hypothetical protein ACP6PL_05860 [Dapis sp. BLCC M126]
MRSGTSIEANIAEANGGIVILDDFGERFCVNTLRCLECFSIFI